MNILYIGSGFVGACSAAVSADSGHNVLVFDVDKEKIKKLSSHDRDIVQSCLFEDGLGDLLIRNQERINFTTDYSLVEKFLDNVDVVFMCLPTPEIGETGESDLTYYVKAAGSLSAGLKARNGGAQNKYVVIVNKSTVPVDMVGQTNQILDKAGVINYGVVSNPEFLVEGKAIAGSIHPERVVVGAWSEKDFAIMRQVYLRFYNATGISYIEVNPKEAAASKLLANYVLFNKLAVCFDVVGRTCEQFSDLNFENIRKVLITDSRIGSWGFYDSLYAGGSCFIKDARSLSHQLKVTGTDTVLVDDIYLANKRQLQLFLDRAQAQGNIKWKKQNVALLGLAFKQDTNDTRNSPSLDIAKFLLDQNVGKINCYDPAATELFKKDFPASEVINYCSDEVSALKDVSVVIISTDWPQFRGLASLIKSTVKPGALIMDGRRMLSGSYDELQKLGYNIIAVGSPYLPAKK